MSANRRAHTYAVRPSIGGPPIVTVTVDRQEQLLIVQTTRGDMTLDIITARALWMVICEAVYEQHSVRPHGPTLVLECDRGTGRPVALCRDER